MYKVFEEHDDGPHFLYHGLEGSRRVPLGRWLRAERKWIHEGSNPHYWSAFHVFSSLADVRRWARMARKTRGRVCVRVSTRTVRHKPTRGLSFLARHMQVTSGAWRRRIPLGDL
jgi:hypothetical protein